ncbi:MULTISPECIES: CheR family methyltransferase [Sphingomonas]|jgi:chemotaxis protein methyltransferase CheR|uniref:Chemotaxis protein methyltransferase n=2 Tax=Sphingomonas TaxID=13687 RepID=A0ABR5YA40_9SPHN|nr:MULTISPECIES: protein-glutamate O-methyltransferase CheR [Sphingomonas]KZE08556.1 chemotaxis protein CheR [Sphingomonas hankookensis]PZT92702.1 MAG: protein-glutamate O-methyltransferase CheR [Sphingomonas sp.]RSV24324.1 protein-glutamate O-methyltransferase CheR [Sphingomonas sp. ABOLH]WCP71309.1 protein-glutamate O-methyltransferase CheR [Sphingomonas hankookensis]
MSALPAPSPDLDRLSPHKFAKLSALIYDKTGIKMPATKVTMLQGRLQRRLREVGIATLDAYCDHLFDGSAHPDEIINLINAVTTNKTDFFREPGHFDFMAKTALPTLADSGRRRIRAWSAACSTGAEPYTMAMVLDQFAQKSGVDYGILATDIDTTVLETARRGIYPTEMVEPVPASLRQRYVAVSRDRKANQVRMVPALRSAIGFARLNLMEERYPVGEPMDLIFCRNVLIYFDKETQERVVRRLCANLRPGGYLFLGHSESIAGMDLPVRTVSYTVFTKD